MHRILIVLAAGLLAGCAHTPSNAVAPAPVPDAPGVPIVYHVTAPVIHLAHSGDTLACNAVLQSLPPAGCSGVRLAGLGRHAVAGTRALPGGAWQTPVLRIVGVWDGGVLHVRRAIPSSARSAAPAPPAACSVAATHAARALQRALTRRAARMHLLGTGPCGSRVWALFAVVDPATRRAIHERYGCRVLVRAWLRPAG